MALSKEIALDQITVTETGIVLVREVTRIIEAGAEISKTYHRISLTPGQDISDQPQKIRDICNTVWTPEVIEDYELQQSQNIPVGV